MRIDGEIRFEGFSYQYRGTSESFEWNPQLATREGNIAAGAYAVVRCLGEDHFRALSCPPTALGEAGGHAGLAFSRPVAFAGEIELGAGNKLENWTSVSGTYQVPEQYIPPEDKQTILINSCYKQLPCQIGRFGCMCSSESVCSRAGRDLSHPRTNVGLSLGEYAKLVSL